MRSALAIASVTAVLKSLLENMLTEQSVSANVGGNILVTALAPDRVDVGKDEKAQLNLFMYQVTPNAGWRNVGLPSRDSRGARINNPPLALDLHYLVTAYGPKDFFTEILLGYAMQLFHEKSVLSRDAIRKALSPQNPPADFPAALAESNLADQIEQLKVTLKALDTEEMSKLWAAMQAHYRPTAAYQVTVVLVESDLSTKSPLPVLARDVSPSSLGQPVIEKILAAAGEYEPVLPGSSLFIRGRRLRAENMQVLIGGVDLTQAVTEMRETEIKLLLPDPLPAGLYAGVQTVQIVHRIDLGEPPAPHAVFESNLGALVLRPIITPTVDSAVTEVVNGVNVKKGKVKVVFKPKVGKSQRINLLFNELNPPADSPGRAYSFKAPLGNGIPNGQNETDTVKIAYKNVIPGDYLVRAQVDGAESVLEVDAAGKYSKPAVTI